MGLLIVAVGLLLIIGGLIVVSWGIVALALHLAFAGLIGWLADAVTPGELPFGWLGAIAAGLLGSWLGRILLGDFGPALFGFNIIPALVGAVLLALVASLVFGRATREAA